MALKSFDNQDSSNKDRSTQQNAIEDETSFNEQSDEDPDINFNFKS